MRQPQNESAGWVPRTHEERLLVSEELKRVVTSTYFSSSRRYPELLRFVVERTLDGRVAELKERTLGIELFGRDLTYDTHCDPIVRVTASEVRKRLQQFYADVGNSNAIHIEMAPGSYVPVLRITRPLEPEPSNESSLASTLPAGSNSEIQQRRNTFQSLRLPILAMALIATTCLGLWLYHLVSNRRDPFWGPLSADDRSVVICTPTHSRPRPADQTLPTPLDIDLIDAVRNYGAMTFDDASAQTRVAARLTQIGKNFRLLSSERATFADLQSGPVVLIGAISNPWSLRLTEGLRFHFSSSGRSRIIDAKKQIDTPWALDGHIQVAALTRDYAIIARFHDKTTGQLVFLIAGLGSQGTAAAGDLVADGKQSAMLFSQAPTTWKSENFEAVIETQTINGIPGPPHLLATEYW